MSRAGAVYYEPGRSYRSCAGLAVLILAGLLLDLALGGGRAHLFGWLIAFVLVVGVDALTVHAARAFRSVTVDDTHVRVGDAALERAVVVAAEPVTETDGPVLGRSAGLGLPRGWRGLRLEVAGGVATTVATRHPDRLSAVLGTPAPIVAVRVATAADLLTVPEIDERAETLFRVAGYQLPELPFATEEFARAAAVFVHGQPPDGFVWLSVVDGNAHVVELGVLPGRMRRGIGTALLAAAVDWARANGYAAITLTTYAHVPWNGPFYAARGFASSDATSLTPGLAAIHEQEVAVGLDRAGPRIVMRQELR